MKNQDDKMQKKIKVMFVVDNLNAGGAERVIRTLADKFNKQIFEVTLLLFNYNHNEKKKYSIPDGINIVVLNKNKKNVLFSLIKKIKDLSPILVISTLAPVNIICILAKIIINNKNIKFIIRETTIKSISIDNTKSNIFEKIIYKLLIRILYKFADSIIAISEGSKMDLVQKFNINESKIKVIFNPLDIKDIREKSKEKILELSNDSTKIICVGSLVKSKGHIYLIEATDILIKEYKIPIDLYFVGDGNLKSLLQSEVSSRGLEDFVHFLGFQANPYKFIKNSDLFVLPALWEGFGNVIIEAMACETPVIATNCESGPKEIITNRINGILIEPKDVFSLVAAINEVIYNDELRKEIKEKGSIRANDFDIEIIIKEYEKHAISLIK